MTTTRNGKIAHLPHRLRESLNQRLHDGIPGHKLLAWLNAEPDAQRILAEYYPGRRITQQNLSEWRQGGYQDWVNLQRANNLTLQLAQDPESIDLGISPQKIVESMATITAAEFVRAAEEKSRACTTTQERWEHVCEINTELSRLRQGNHRVALATLQKQQWEYQVATDLETTKKAAEAKVRHELLTHLEKIMGVRVSASTPTDTSNPSDLSGSTPTTPPSAAPQQSENQVKTAHFPSGTHPNHAHNISSPSTSKTGRAELPLRPNIKAATRHAQSTTTDISTANPPIQQGKNHVETAHFPSRTNPNQTHNYFTPTPYAPIPPTPKFLRRLLPPISPALACGTGLSHGGPTTLCVLGASVAAPRTGTLEHLFNGLSTLPV